MDKLTNQHGDVLLFKVNSIPSSAKKVESKNKIVIMDGEVTGHQHAISDTSIAELFMGEDNVKYLNVKEDTIITHEEHLTQPVEAGIYRVGQVQEYDYDEMEARAVKD